MKAKRFTRFSIGLLLLVFASFPILKAASGGYHLLKKYSFGAAEGSTREYFDYVTVDSAARRVYLSHGTEIKVLDADTGALVGNITGLKQDHGVAVATEFGRGFISDGAQGKVIIFDLKSLKVTGEAVADKDADCVIYDPFSKRVFVMDGDPHNATVIDAKTGSVLGKIDLGGGPEFAVADGKGTVFINLEDKSELVAVDSTSMKIKSRWPLAPAGAPTALAIDVPASSPLQRRPQPANDGCARLRHRKSDSVLPDFRWRRCCRVRSGNRAASSSPLAMATVHVFHEDSPDKLAKSKPSRPNTAPRPWASTPRPTTCS